MNAGCMPVVETSPEIPPDFYDKSKWLRTMPGRSGTFLGHFIPAVFFAISAFSVLLLSLKRANNLPPGKGFAEMHIPERDPAVLRRVSYCVLVATGIGITVEAAGGWLAIGNPFFQLAHITLYSGYLIMAICAILESKGRLPPDTHRAALVMALVASYLMWHSHGTMKKFMADKELHILLSYINLLNAVVVGYSMRFTDSVIAFVTGYALMLLQAMWLLTAGAYEGFLDLPHHDIATYLACQSLIVLLGVVIVVATFGPAPSDQDNPNFRSDFTSLKYHDDDDDGDRNLT